MADQRLVWCGVETGAVSRELSIPNRKEILAIPYVFILFLMIKLVIAYYK